MALLDPHAGGSKGRDRPIDRVISAVSGRQPSYPAQSTGLLTNTGHHPPSYPLASAASGIMAPSPAVGGGGFMQGLAHAMNPSLARAQIAQQELLFEQQRWADRQKFASGLLGRAEQRLQGNGDVYSVNDRLRAAMIDPDLAAHMNEVNDDQRAREKMAFDQNMAVGKWAEDVQNVTMDAIKQYQLVEATVFSKVFPGGPGTAGDYSDETWTPQMEQALIISFAKIWDPRSIVSINEQQAVAGDSVMSEWIKYGKSLLGSKERLDEEGRKALTEMVIQFGGSMHQELGRSMSVVNNFASRFGIPTGVQSPEEPTFTPDNTNVNLNWE